MRACMELEREKQLLLDWGRRRWSGSGPGSLIFLYYWYKIENKGCPHLLRAGAAAASGLWELHESNGRSRWSVHTCRDTCIHAEAHSFCRAERDLWTPKRSYPRWVTTDPGEQEDMAVSIHVTNPWTCLETALERVCHNKYWATICLLLIPISGEPTETPGTFKCFFFSNW